MVYAAVGNCTYQFTGQERAFMANPAKILGPFLMIPPVVFLLLGVVFTLAANYFSAFPKDSKKVKGLILVILALNILKGVQAIGLPWRKFIVNYGDYSKIVTLTYVERTNVLASTLASAAAQVYLIHRCYKLSGLNEASKKSGYVFLGLVTSTWLLEVASAIWVTFYLPTNFVNTKNVAAVARLPPASHLATDLLITGFTFYYLISSRTGFRNTDTMIKRLQVILIQSAAPPAAICIVWMIVAGLPQPGLQALAHSSLPGLDAISVLYSLNSRAEFKYDSSTNQSTKSGGHDTAIQLQDRSRTVGVTVSVNRYVEQSPAPAAQVVNMNRNSLDSDDYKKI